MAITWKIDPAHSEIQFKVRHLMITTITGYLKKFEGHIEAETDDFDSTTVIHFAGDTSSIDTNNEQRDTHLRSSEFFDSEKHREILFSGTRYETLASEATLSGNLTIHGVTKPVSFTVEYGGTVKDPYGQTKAGFTVTGKISRKEFGLTWDAVTEAGQIVVGDEIKLHAEIQLIREA